MNNPLNQDFENPNYLENIIRQKTLMQSMGSPMPEANAVPQNSQASTPDLTVHHLVGTMPNSAQANPAPAQNTIQPEAQQAMIPKVGPINPQGPHPFQDQNIQAQMNEPMHANYHPSKLRQVLSTIAGMGVGAFQGGEAGSQLRKSLEDAPYNEQHNDWQQYAKNKLGLANEEYSQTAGKASEDANVALANLRRKQAGIIPGSPEEDVTNKSAIRHAGLAGTLPEDVQVELKDHNKVWAIEDPNTGVLYQKDATAKNGRGAVISDDSYIKRSEKGKSLTETPKNENPFNAYMEGILTKNPNKSKDEIALDWVNKETSGKDKNKAEFDTFYEGYKKDHPNAKDHQIVAAYAALPRPTPGVTMLAPTPTGYRPISVRPGGPDIPKDVQNPTSVSQENTDTSTTRTMKEAAPHVVSFMDKLDKEVDQNVKDLGPEAGRWSDFWTGKVGAPNPNFARLRTDAALAKTMLMRMHLGARGGQGMYEHFNNMLDLAGQDPQNLHAAIGAIRDYANEISNSSHNGGSDSPVEEYVRDPKTNKLVLKGK